MNSVLSRLRAKFACFDVSNLYLGTLLNQPEYVRINISDILQEFVDEYNLTQYERNGWVYFEIRKGVYSLPKSGHLSNDQLCFRLKKDVY